MENKMTTGAAAKTILTFAMPILLGQILQQLYNIVDTMIVGRYVGVGALAAVGATWSLNYIVGYFCIGTCIGISVPLSQAYGAEDQHRLRCYFVNGIYFVAMLAVIVTSITSFFSGHFLTWLRTPADIIGDAKVYLLIIFLGMPFTILYNFCFGILMAFGDSKKSSVFMAISTVLNLGLDLIMVLVFHMGVAGVAIATVVSKCVAGLCSLNYILKKYKILFPQENERKFDMYYIKNIIKMSMPMGLQYSITAIGAIILQYSVNNLGSAAVAGFSTGSKIKGFFMCPLNALGTALSSFAGQNYGAGNLTRVKEGLRSTMKIGILYSLGVIMVIFIAGDGIAALFVDSDKTTVIGYAAKFMRYVSVFHIELAILFSFRYLVQGIGYGKYSICSGMAEMVGRAMVAIFLVPMFGFEAVCWNEGITFLAGILVIVPVYFMLMGKLNKKEI